MVDMLGLNLLSIEEESRLSYHFDFNRSLKLKLTEFYDIICSHIYIIIYIIVFRFSILLGIIIMFTKMLNCSSLFLLFSICCFAFV